jgi:hypothetical protein
MGSGSCPLPDPVPNKKNDSVENLRGISIFIHLPRNYRPRRDNGAGGFLDVDRSKFLQSPGGSEKIFNGECIAIKKIQNFLWEIFRQSPHNFFHQEPGPSCGNFRGCDLYDNLFCPELGPDFFGKVFSNLS